MAAGPFPTTSWSRIRRSAANEQELGTLLQVYWGPIYAYVRRKGIDRERAADVTQGFLADVVLRRNLLAGARQDLGRFRSYLLTALGRYLIDLHRHEHGRLPGSGVRVAIPTAPEILDAAEPDTTDDPVQAFHRQWATTVLNRAIEHVEADCRQRGLEVHWTIYDARILRPACAGGAAIEVRELATQFGVDEVAVYSMLNTVKRKVRKEIEAIILETIEDPSELACELAELRNALAAQGG